MNCNTLQSVMHHRYKILEVRITGHGNMPGIARTLYVLCSIGELLGNEIRNLAIEAGGTIPIPEWFRDWCRKMDIPILEIESAKNFFSSMQQVATGWKSKNKQQQQNEI